MSRVIKKLKNKDILIIPITMTLLSICGTTFGMSGGSPAVLCHLHPHHDGHRI